MKEIAEATLKKLSEDQLRIASEISQMEQALAKKRADHLATAGAVQAIQYLLREAAENGKKCPEDTTSTTL